MRGIFMGVDKLNQPIDTNELMSLDDMANGHLDVATLGEAANEDKVIISRLGRQYPSAPMASRLLVENGLLGATPFSTYSAMTASALVDGDYAIVTNDADLGKNGVYEKVSGAWVYSKYNPAEQSKAVVSSYLADNPEMEASHNFTDKNGFVIARLLASGVFDTRGIDIGGEQLVFEKTSGSDINIIDANGFVMSSTSPPESHTNVVDSFATNAPLGYQKNHDINAIMMYGQSLSRGRSAIPTISNTQEYNNLTLASGVLKRPDESGYSAATFKPLIEQSQPGEGETPLSGALNGLSRRIAAIGLPIYSFFGGSMGRGGQSAQELSRDTDNFNNLTQYIKDAYNLALAQGSTFNLWSMLWVQGEQDNTDLSNDKLAYQYTTRWLAEVWQPFKEYTLNLTKQSFSPYLISYQVSGHRKSSTDTMHIAKAQWRASKEFSDIVLAVPNYIMPTVEDNQHLTNEGSWLLGEYMSRALFYTMIQRQKWRPLEPVSVDWQATHIDIEFYVPQGSLVLDDALCALYENFGFVMRDANDLVVNNISSVAITSNKNIRINLSAPSPYGAVITYGRGKPGDPLAGGKLTGSRGNLRDTHGDVDNATSPLGNVFDLHNPCVCFEYSQQLGFAI